jgi:endonuclease-3
MKIQEKIKLIFESLEQLYVEAPLELRYSNEFELLIAVILSAQCTDERVNKVTEKLFNQYKHPIDYLKVSTEKLENDIHPTGFYRQKTKLVQSCCQKLVDDFAGQLPRDINQMVQLPGVGRKTAALVLGNVFGFQQGIAVDTHVKRVVKRWQLSVESSVEKVEKKLMEIVPQKKWTWFSNATILFGRYICQARKPKCRECPFYRWCPAEDKL